jgi:quercetin dioxygenase-like cupin family protein
MEPKPFDATLGAAGEYLPLLTGENARAMRAGMVTAAPGASCGEHSTEGYEELLAILEGEGEGRRGGYGVFASAAGRVVSVPPHPIPNIVDLGPGLLRYVLVVAPSNGT